MLAPVERIELPSWVLETPILPLYYTGSGGEGEIRTHGTLRYDSFQDCCLKPDSATSPKYHIETY